MQEQIEPSLPMLGWREWVALPELNIPAIKAKVDTGAKTSALHAFQVERFQSKGVDMVRFWMHPIQLNEETVVQCQAPLLDEREVSDSGGHKEQRLVIATTLQMKDFSDTIELTLTNRDTMRFRMLLGRRVMEQKFLVDPGASYLQSVEAP